MGAIQSSKVAAGIKVLASHLNNIWDDLMTNHDHSTGKGATVDHVDLANKGTNTHAQIDTHLGEDQGVHGHNSVTYIAGSLGGSAGLVVQGGSDTLSSSSKAVTFPVAFSTTPVAVVATWGNAKTGSDNFPSDIYVTDVTATGFTAHSQVGSFYNSLFYWIAVGTKAA